MCRTCITLLLGIALFGMGCGRTKTYTGPDGEKVTVSKKNGNAEFTFTGKKGEKIQLSANEQGTSLPDNFPKDAPIYPGATVAMSTTMPDGMMVMLKSADSMKQVKEFYEKTLKEQGWENESSFNTPQGATMANKKDKRTLAVTINSGNETVIQLIVTQEK